MAFDDEDRNNEEEFPSAIARRYRVAPPTLPSGNGAPMPKFPGVPFRLPEDQQDQPDNPIPPQIAMPQQAMPNMSTPAPMPPVNPHTKEIARLESTGSGVSQIQNPFLHGLAKVGDVIGSIAAPRIAAQIPGTTLHHEQLLGQQEGLLNQDVRREQEQAHTANLNAETEQKAHPKPQVMATDQGIVRIPQEGEASPVTMGGQSLNPPEKNTKPSLAETAEGRAQLSEQYGLPIEDRRTYILTGKLPTEPKDNRDDKAIEIYSKPKLQWTPKEQAYIQGYEEYVNKTKVQPGVLRMQVLGNMREYPSVGPNGEAVWINANNINSANQAGTPTGVAQYSPEIQGNIAAAKEAVHGVPVIQTALHHLNQLDTANKALEMGDIKALNAIAKAYQVQVGNEPLATYRGIQQIIRGDILAASSAVGTKNENEEKAIDAITDPTNPQKANHASIVAIRQLMTDRLQAKGEIFKQAQSGGNIFTPQSQAQVGGGTQKFTDNGKTYNIPADKIEAFKKDHPNAR